MGAKIRCRAVNKGWEVAADDFSVSPPTLGRRWRGCAQTSTGRCPAGALTASARLYAWSTDSPLGFCRVLFALSHSVCVCVRAHTFVPFLSVSCAFLHPLSCSVPLRNAHDVLGNFLSSVLSSSQETYPKDLTKIYNKPAHTRLEILKE